MNARAGRFPLFDSLRAIAAISVVMTHAAFASQFQETDNPFVPYTGRLEVGVSIFFLISGFLLFRPFADAHLHDRPLPASGAYAWRRFLRIAPAYWVALTVIGLAVGLPLLFTSDGWPLYYGFAQIYDPHYVLGGLSQAWTLCTEISFYAFLPLYALALRAVPVRNTRHRYLVQAGGLLVLVAVAVAWKAWRMSLADPDYPAAAQGLLWLPAYLDQFAIGMALAVMSVAIADRDGDLWRWLRPIDRFPAIGWALALVAFWAVSTQIGYDGHNPFEAKTTVVQVFERHYLYALVGLGLLLPAIFGDQTRGYVRRFLGQRWLLYLGVISYGIYLWHVGVVKQLDDWHLFKEGDGPMPVVLIWFALALGASVLLATISWYCLERPVLKLRRLVPDRRRPVPGEPPAPGGEEPGPLPAEGISSGVPEPAAGPADALASMRTERAS